MPSELGPSKFVGKQQYTYADLELLRKIVSCNTMSDASKIEIMERMVAPCLHVMMDIKGKTFKALLVSGSIIYRNMLGCSHKRSEPPRPLTP